jgi:hypothetical protein
LLIALFLAGLTGNLPAADNGPVGIVTKVRGQVTARKTGDEKPATLRVGDALSVGQILQSGKDASVQLVLSDDSIIFLLPNSTLQIGQYTFSSGDNRRAAVIKVIDGSARFVIYKRRSGDSRFAVISDHASINTGNADFVVKVSKNKTEVDNIGRSLGITSSSRLQVGYVHLGTNQRSVVAEKAPPSQPSTITPEQRRKYLKDAEL